MNWSEPSDFREWFSRLFSLRSLLVILLVYSVALTELRFDWVEQMVGTYLSRTNTRRPQSGAIWEKGKETLTAQKTLEQIVTDRESSQRIAREAETFSQIAEALTPSHGVMISAAHFRDLYLALPPAVAQDIVSPFELLLLQSSGRWERAYFRKFGASMKVFLLDMESRVLRELDVPPELLSRVRQQDAFSTGVLEDYPSLRNRIYPARDFFEALADQPDEIQRSILPAPERLLAHSRRILRVGVSDEALSGLVDIGLEFEADGNTQVMVVQARDWAVWRLRLELEAMAGPPRPAPDIEAGGIP
jgi:hypothetical protein